MIKNRRLIASSWASDPLATYADVGRQFGIDRRTVWSIVRAFYRVEKIAEIMSTKRINRRKCICDNCSDEFVVKFPCVAKERQFCNDCYSNRVFYDKS
jgi:hypothetical protein